MALFLQEEPSPTTGISLPAYTAALGLEAGAQAFAAAKSGQATTKVKEVGSDPSVILLASLTRHANTASV
jgi:hypothetical protein